MPIIGGSTYFRPAVLLTFIAEFAAFDGIPRASRAINLLIHLGNCFLVALLVMRCAALAAGAKLSALPPFGATLLATAAALVYGLHPSLIESAGWVSGRFDLMVTFFSLLAILAAVQTDRAPRHWVIAVLVFLALLSKEMAIVLPAVVWVFRCVAIQRQPWDVQNLPLCEWKLLGAIALSTGAYIALRSLVHPGLVHVDPTVASQSAHPVRFLILVGTTLLFYLRLLVYPYRDTNPMHPFDLSDVASASLAGGLAITCLVFGLMLPLIAWRLRWPALWLWCAALFALAPVLNIIPLRLGGNIGENRFLTLPLALTVCALSYSFALGYARLVDRRKLFVTASAIPTLFLVLVNSAFVHATLPIWRSDVTLMASSFAQYPNDVRAASSYLRATMNTASRTVALGLVEKQFGGPDIPVALLTPLATALALEGRRLEAITYFEKALKETFENSFGDIDPVARYAEVRQAWGEPELAQPMIDRVKAIRASKPAAGDDYLIAHLEMRQALLLQDDARFIGGLTLMRASVPMDMQILSRIAITTFRNAVCKRAGESGKNAFCDDEHWRKLVE